MATAAQVDDGAQTDTSGPRRGWFVIATLLVISLFSHLDRTIISILQIPIKAELGLSDAQLGGLTGLAFACVYSLFAVPMGRLGDRLDRRRLMSAALVFWSAMTALSGLAANYVTLVACRMGLAIGESVCSPVSLSLISDYFPPRRRALPIAIWATAVPLGTMLGLTVGGWVAQMLGWRMTLAVIGACGLIPLLMLHRLVEPARGQYDTVRLEQPAFREAFSQLFRSRAFRLILAGATLQSYVVVSMQFWSAPFYVRVHGLSLSHTGLVLGVLFGVGGGLGALVGGTIAGRVIRRDTGGYGLTAAAGCLLLIPASLVQLLSASMVVSLGAGLIAMTMLNIYLAPVNAATQSLVPSSMRAFTSSIVLVTTNLIGAGGGPFVTGVLSDRFNRWLGTDLGIRPALCCALPAALGAAICFYRSAVHLRRELAAELSRTDPVQADAGCQTAPRPATPAEEQTR